MDYRRISKKELVDKFFTYVKHMLNLNSVKVDEHNLISESFREYSMGNLTAKGFQQKINELFKDNSSKGNIYDSVASCLNNFSYSDKISFFSNVLDTLAEVVYDYLRNVSETESIMIPLFEGMNITGSFIPEKNKVNNLTGETIITSKKVQPTVKFTRTCIDKLSRDL